MKRTRLLLLLYFFLQIMYSQQLPRQIVKGVVVNEAKNIDNVKITNLTIKKSTVSDKSGEFYIEAKEKDTLLFSLLGFKAKKYVIPSYKFNQLQIELDPEVNNLEEVIITPHTLTGNLEKDYKNIKTTTMTTGDLTKLGPSMYAYDDKSSPANALMPGYYDPRYMMDLMAIGGKMIRLFKKPDKRTKTPVFTSKEIFPVAVRQRVADSFFSKTLQLKDEEIGLFLSYWEKDPKAVSLLEVKNEFDLIDFLVSKNNEYQKLKKE